MQASGSRADHSNRLRWWIRLWCVVGVVLVSCGWFIDSPGRTACHQFDAAVEEWREGTLGTFDLVKRLYEAGSHAESAGPEIARASANLVAALDTFSLTRLAVNIELMDEACVDAGYLGPLGPI